MPHSIIEKLEQGQSVETQAATYHTQLDLATRTDNYLIELLRSVSCELATRICIEEIGIEGTLTDKQAWLEAVERIGIAHFKSVTAASEEIRREDLLGD